MRTLIMLIAIAALCASGACTTTSTPAPAGPTNHPDGPPDGNPDAIDPADVGSNGSGDEADAAYDLNGFWDDGGRVIRITHTGNEVVANYVETYICDHTDGPVPPGETHDGVGETSETNLDFHATLDGDQLTGETNVCNWESGGATHELGAGLMLASVELTINDDGTELTGFWFNEHDETEEPITITRVPAP